MRVTDANNLWQLQYIDSLDGQMSYIYGAGNMRTAINSKDLNGQAQRSAIFATAKFLFVFT